MESRSVAQVHYITYVYGTLSAKSKSMFQNSMMNHILFFLFFMHLVLLLPRKPIEDHKFVYRLDFYHFYFPNCSFCEEEEIDDDTHVPVPHGSFPTASQV